jgi:hypothetical protein
MRANYLLTAALLLTLSCGAGCGERFSKDDAALLDKYGGMYIPTGEGPGADIAPVDAVMFDSPERALTDADFTEVFSALMHMDPYRLHLRGRHTMGDESIARLNRLRALRVLDVSGTDMTLGGLQKLKINSLKTLYISPDNFTEAEAQQLQKALPDVKVTRFRT